MKFQILLFALLLTFGACTSEQSTTTEETKTDTSSISETSRNETTTKTTATESPKKEPVRIGKAPKRLEMQETIEKMHENLMTQMHTDGKLNANDIDAYHKESELYMSIYGDTLAAEYIFNAADLYRGIGDYKKAADMWFMIYKAYEKEHPKSVQASVPYDCGDDSVVGHKV